MANVKLVLDDKKTVLVGANNSGKTSCIGALHTFLKSPDNLKIRDVSKLNWRKINQLGRIVEKKFPKHEKMEKFSCILTSLLPCLDIEINAMANEAYKVRDILPDLEWNGEPLLVRIKYEAIDMSKLFEDFTKARAVVSEHKSDVSLWPKNLFDFLEKGRNFNKFIKQKHYILSKLSPSEEEVLQPLRAMPICGVCEEKVMML